MKYATAVLAALFLFLTAPQYSHAQDADTDPVQNDGVQSSGADQIWKTLSKITFKKQYDEIMGFKIDVPVFSQEIQDLDGKEITVKGYIIPVEGYKSHNEFVFSAFPYNMCFFCGGAGPETVMEVSSVEPIQYSADAVTIRGKLELNAEDINRLMYILTEVELVD